MRKAIAEWKQNKQGKRGRPRRFSDLAITTALMVKRRIWRKLHIAVDTSTHKIIVAEQSRAEQSRADLTYPMPKCSPAYLKQTGRNIIEIQVMALMTQGIAMMLYGSSERLRLSRYQKGLRHLRIWQ